MISLIISLVVLALVYWIVTQIPLPIPAWFWNVLFGLLAIAIILQFFGVISGPSITLWK